MFVVLYEDVESEIICNSAAAMNQHKVYRIIDKNFCGFSAENSNGALAITSITTSDGSVLDIEEVNRRRFDLI